MDNKRALILVSSEEICHAIEEAMMDKKRNISNEEVQQLLWKLVEQKKATFIGTTNQDVSLLTGNLRENGIKVKNLSEEKRKNEKHN